jgi:crotonobetainyl-CoA:carnitine CoA-transferase CaiB-like acyl-CoA transferase
VTPVPEGPFAGVRVLELTSAGAGRTAGMLLADLGADVARILPGGRAPTGWTPEDLCLDRGKQLVTGRDAGSAGELRRLALAADVVLDDATPGTSVPGLGPAGLLAARPSLVHVALPPHGTRGRWRDLPADPLLLGALGGFATHHPAHEPGRPVASVVPLVGAVQGALAAVAAAAGLLGVHTSGHGRALEVSGLHASAACLGTMMTEGLDVERLFSPGSRLPGSPNFRTYRCADGRFLHLAALTADFFLRALDVLDRMDVLVLPEVYGEFAALRSGQVDAIMAKVTQQEQAEQLAADGRFTVVTERPTSWYAMYLDTALAPLDDVRVRRALNYAVDREAIDAAVFDGNCAPTSQPLQEGVVGHSPAVGYTHDRQRARELLAEAGLGGGVTLTAVTSAVSASQLALAQVLQAQLGEVGIRLDVRGMDFTQAVADFRDRKAHGFIGSHPGVADPGMTVSDAYLSAFFPGPLPEGYEDLLARAADSTKPADERRALLEAASATASEHALDLYLCGYSASFVSTPDITGFDAMTAPDQGGPFDLRYVGRAEAP